LESSRLAVEFVLGTFHKILHIILQKVSTGERLASNTRLATCRRSQTCNGDAASEKTQATFFGQRRHRRSTPFFIFAVRRISITANIAGSAL